MNPTIEHEMISIRKEVPAMATAVHVAKVASLDKTSTAGGNVAKTPRFGEILRDELIAREITTGNGNTNWAAFAEMLDGVHYETLRKAVVGDRVPHAALMEEVARVLDVDPRVFSEYVLWETQRLFDPREVGIDDALANLQDFVERSERKTKRR